MLIAFFQYFLPFSLLLGTLVFIHELGHFLVARYFGVRVEVFSLGFGPKILKFKKGDTTYCISLIPLGGYVKMFGDNPKQVLTAEERPFGFLSQKVGPKMAIALGGPLMNLFLAVFIFMALGFIGSKKALPVLGDIFTDTTAYEYGFRSGDRILSVNGQKTAYWEDVKSFIKENPDSELKFQVERSEFLQTIHAVPQKFENTRITELASFIGKIEGFTISSQSAHVGVSRLDSIAYQKGLRTFDEVKEINGEKISNWRELKNKISQIQTGVFNVKVQRDSELLSFDLPALGTIKRLGLESTELYLDRVKKNSPGDKSGLQKKDRLLAWNGSVLKTWSEFSEFIKNYKDHPKPFELSILREGVEKKLLVHTEKMSTVHPDGNIEDRYMVGVASAQYASLPELKTVRIKNPLKAFIYGVGETSKWTAVTGRVLWRLVTGNISYRIVGGPLSIAKAAKRSFSDSVVEFLAIMAIISVNLFLMNLLPIPVLDGGHLLLFTIEAFKGSALSPRKIEIVQTCGFVVVLFFIVLTLINDIGNWNLIW